jgi:hypothetical protein
MTLTPLVTLTLGKEMELQMPLKRALQANPILNKGRVGN